MAEATIKTRLIEDPKSKHPKQTCFNLRKRLGSSNGLLRVVKIIIGIIIASHILLSYLIVIVRYIQIESDYIRFKLALYPLLVLSCEVETMCIVMIGIIISDIFKDSMSMAVWQRSAIGRIFRNMFVALMLLIFFSLCICCTTATPVEISLNSAGGTFTPIIFLLAVSLAKLIFIKSKLDQYWIIICLFLIIEVALIIISVDFQVSVSWALIFGPLIGISFVCLVASFEYYKLGFIKAFAGIFASLTVGTFLVVTCLTLENYFYSDFIYKGTGILAFVIFIGSFCEDMGDFVLDILFGHLETDYFYFLNPPKKQDGRMKSITM